MMMMRFLQIFLFQFRIIFSEKSLWRKSQQNCALFKLKTRTSTTRGEDADHAEDDKVKNEEAISLTSKL